MRAKKTRISITIDEVVLDRLKKAIAIKYHTDSKGLVSRCIEEAIKDWVRRVSEKRSRKKSWR